MNKQDCNGIRVLIIDDEEDFALTLAHRLTLRGMRVNVVCSGREGLAFLRASAGSAPETAPETSPGPDPCPDPHPDAGALCAAGSGAAPVDMLLLDMRMPGLSGVDVLRAVRITWPELPVLILTGHCSEKDFATALSLGVREYHAKPLRFDELLRSIVETTR